jgi:ribosome biogenesis GTPase / thiamine phosphate phosphatase
MIRRWMRWAGATGSHRKPIVARNTAASPVSQRVDRDQMLLVGRQGFFRAKISGKYLYECAQATDLPCVGDWVCVQKSTADQFGLVHGILERRTYLRRKAPGESVAYQMIAANVDFVIVVQSCRYDFNVKRLERYLVMIQEGGARPIILLTKTDLVAPGIVAAQIEALRDAGIAEPVVTVSNVTREGMDDLERVLEPGRTYCFVGSSGVGKSTIINALMGQNHFETQDVSDTGEGRHTTVRRELGILAADGGIEASYPDILALSSQCRFRDCTHANEPGCAVREAVAGGKVSADHYENFLKLRQESRYHEMSHAEKRKKDRAFGRFIKSARKDLEDG